MSRYIDADALIRQITSPYTEYTVMIQIRRALKEFVNSAPSIDIVRCKDCKHCHYEQEDDIYHCYKLFHRFYDTEHYCSYGERRE